MFSLRMFTCTIRGDHHDKKMIVRPNSEVIIRNCLCPQKSHSRNSMIDEQGGKMTLFALFISHIWQ